MQENEDSLEDWAESLSELSAMKTDLSQYIIADDVLLLQEQVEHLHCQWEELCLKVSLLNTSSSLSAMFPWPACSQMPQIYKRAPQEGVH